MCPEDKAFAEFRGAIGYNACSAPVHGQAFSVYGIINAVTGFYPDIQVFTGEFLWPITRKHYPFLYSRY